jgi:hypothetical protein
MYREDNLFLLLEAAIEARDIASDHYHAGISAFEFDAHSQQKVFNALSHAYALVDAIEAMLPPIIIQVAGRSTHNVVSDIVEASRKLRKEISLPEVMPDGEYPPGTVEFLISDLDEAGLSVTTVTTNGSVLFLQEISISRR